MNSVTFIDCELDRSLFNNCIFDNVLFKNCTIKDSCIIYSDLNNVRFENCIMAGSSYQGSKLSNVNLSCLNACDSSFYESTISDSDFEGCILLRTSFECAKISNTNFNNANLNHTNMFEASIFNCNFEDSTIVGSNMDHTKQWCNNFKNSNLLNSVLTYSNFEKCNFKSVNLTNVQEDDFIGNGNIMDINTMYFSHSPSNGEFLAFTSAIVDGSKAIAKIKVLKDSYRVTPYNNLISVADKVQVIEVIDLKTKKSLDISCNVSVTTNTGDVYRLNEDVIDVDKSYYAESYKEYVGIPYVLSEYLVESMSAFIEDSSSDYFEMYSN